MYPELLIEINRKMMQLRVDIASARAIENYQDAFKKSIQLELLQELIKDKFPVITSSELIDAYAEKYSKEKLKNVKCLVGKDYITGYKEGLSHFLEDLHGV